MPHAIHHVTAISGPASRNLDFYQTVLGLRLVKRTVNFDDPTTWHLYYGDETGRPGTILTFFPRAHAARGRAGIGETQETMLRVPEGSIGFWAHRLLAKGVEHETPTKRFGETVLAFRDPDGMRLSLVASGSVSGGREGASVPPEHGVVGVHGVNLLLGAAEPTGAILEGVLGYRTTGQEGSLTRYRLDGGDLGSVVEIHAAGGFLSGRSGAGSVHHVAFRAAGDAEQKEAVARLRADHGIEPTGQKDRAYFRSVYFREPGGVLLEIATDEPGFTVDEDVASLGTALKLPPFLEPRRSEIAAVLPGLEAVPPAFGAGRPNHREYAS
jgi:glyoxalase family protein